MIENKPSWESKSARKNLTVHFSGDKENQDPEGFSRKKFQNLLSKFQNVLRKEEINTKDHDHHESLRLKLKSNKKENTRETCYSKIRSRSSNFIPFMEESSCEKSRASVLTENPYQKMGVSNQSILYPGKKFQIRTRSKEVAERSEKPLDAKKKPRPNSSYRPRKK